MSQAVLRFTTKSSFVVYLKSSGTGCPAFLFAESGAFDPGWGGSSRVGRLCAFSLKGRHPLKGGSVPAGGGSQLLGQKKISGWKTVCVSFLRAFRGGYVCKRSTASILINNVNSDY